MLRMQAQWWLWPVYLMLLPLLLVHMLLVQPLIHQQLSSYLGGLAEATQLRRLALARCWMPLGRVHSWLPLARLPGSLMALTELRSLTITCAPLRGLPAGLGALRSLRELELLGCTVTRLPASMGDLTGLQRLRLINCTALPKLPESAGALQGLELLDLRGCSCLHNLPASILGRQQSGLRILGMAATRRLSRFQSSAHQCFLFMRSPVYWYAMCMFLALTVINIVRDVQGRPHVLYSDILLSIILWPFCILILFCNYADSSDKCEDEQTP